LGGRNPHLGGKGCYSAKHMAVDYDRELKYPDLANARGSPQNKKKTGRSESKGTRKNLQMGADEHHFHHLRLWDKGEENSPRLNVAGQGEQS